MSKINLNTALLVMIVPALIYLTTTLHSVDVRVARIEQQLIDKVK